MNRYYSFLTILFIVGVWFIFSHPFFLAGEMPYPSTYQVNHFAPWSAYKQFWGPVKNAAMPDIVDQIYPWKHYTIDSWKKGQPPLWNPYSFSGTLHLANYQSAVLSPFNMLFFVFSFVDAWSILVLLEPLIAGLFLYIFARSLSISRVGALIASISFMFCGFLTTWMGYATLGYAILFLPLALFAIEKFYSTQKVAYLALLSISLPLSFFSGHFQTSLYVFLFVAVYLLYRLFLKRHAFFSLYPALFLLFGVLLTMPQLIPSIEFYAQSVRSNTFGKVEVIPWAYLPTLLAPDFFGNPVTRNDWFGHYAEWNAYVGVFPLLFALYTLFRKKRGRVFFFLLAGFVSLLLAFNTPISDLLFKAHIPVLSTSAASRVIVMFSFSMAVLAGFGFDGLMKDINPRLKSLNLIVQTKGRRSILAGLNRRVIVWLIFCFLIFGVLWLIILFRLFLPPDKVGIARSNLMLPTSLFMLGALGIVFRIVFSGKRVASLISYFLLVVVAFDMLRFVIKWTPFDPKEYAFPPTAVTNFFSHISGFERALGNYEAGIAAYYRLPSVEGYDSLYIRRYGEFMSSIGDGKVKPLSRSGVSFSRNGLHASSAVDFLGVKYIIHKVSDDYTGWTFPYWDYPEGQFKRIFNDGVYRIFENTNVLPRAFLVGRYVVIKENQKIVDTMFGKGLDLREGVILEQDPQIQENDGVSPLPKIVKYMPNRVEIQTQSDSERILVLTDSFYPGWRGFVDSQEVPIYRANYAFRALVVPGGAHKVEFVYDPLSFRLGLYLAGVGCAGILIGGFFSVRRKKRVS